MEDTATEPEVSEISGVVHIPVLSVTDGEKEVGQYTFYNEIPMAERHLINECVYKIKWSYETVYY